MSMQITVKILPNDKGSPNGKLADVEVHFTGGPLQGVRLLGFAIWERRSGTGRNVTMPARTYSVNGERRSFSLLRPISGESADMRPITDVILQAYAEHEAQDAQAAAGFTPHQPEQPSKAEQGPQVPEERNTAEQPRLTDAL